MPGLEPRDEDDYKQLEKLERDIQKGQDQRLPTGTKVSQLPPNKSFLLKLEASLENL